MSFFQRLRATLRPGRMDAGLDDELRFHLEQRTEDLIGEGLSPQEARRSAALRFGNQAYLREATRERDTLVWLESILQDFRFAARNLRRSPGFTLTAILSLALGIGANTAIFSLLDSLILKLAPVHDAGGIVRLSSPNGDTFSYPPFDRLRQNSRQLLGVVAVAKYSGPSNIVERGQKSPAVLEAVSGNYFDMLGVEPWRGRVFHARDARAADGAIAVISVAYWQRHYHGDPAALGAHFHWADREFLVAGIAPPAFRGMRLDAPADVWLPLEQTMPPGSLLWKRGQWLHLLARLAPGATTASAAEEASTITQRKVSIEPGGNGFSKLRGRYSRPLIVLECLAGLVLLIACANLAHLLLARAASRQREMAVRQAIGAGRGRLVRQLLTENLLLAGIGGALAVVVAQWVSRAMLAFLPPDAAPALANLGFHLNGRVLALTSGLALLTALASGLAPAVRASGSKLSPGLKEGAGGRTGRRFAGRTLVVAEVALCTLLVLVAGLFVRTLRNLKALDAAFAPEQVLVADVGKATPAQLDALRERILGSPGVRSAGYSQIGQLTGFALDYNIAVKGRQTLPGEDVSAVGERISPGFLPAMGTRLLAGRDFSERDGTGALPVAIVNEAFAKRYLPGSSPVGRRFQIEGTPSVDVEVVGLAADIRWVNLREKPEAMFYRPFQQDPASYSTLAIRTSGELQVLARALPPMARAVDEQLTLNNIVPFTEIEDRTLVAERMVAQISAAFGGLAVLVACIGLYGLLAYSVARRTKEIGVRMALGASRGSVQWMVLRESLCLMLVGFCVGVPCAMAATRGLTTMLFGLTPGDPATIAIGLGLLLVSALAAAEFPARRASRIEPVRALREE